MRSFFGSSSIDTCMDGPSVNTWRRPMPPRQAYLRFQSSKQEGRDDLLHSRDEAAFKQIRPLLYPSKVRLKFFKFAGGPEHLGQQEIEQRHQLIQRVLQLNESQMKKGESECNPLESHPNEEARGGSSHLHRSASEQQSVLRAKAKQGLVTLRHRILDILRFVCARNV